MMQGTCSNLWCGVLLSSPLAAQTAVAGCQKTKQAHLLHWQSQALHVVPCLKSSPLRSGGKSKNTAFPHVNVRSNVATDQRPKSRSNVRL